MSAPSRSWMDYAKCLDMDIHIFYPGAGTSSHSATKICFNCPVRSQCLEYAIEQKELYGIWGGISERRRRSLIRSRYGRSVYYSVIEEVG